MRVSRILAVTAALAAGSSTTVQQAFAETVGKAVSIRTTVTGGKGPLKQADLISQNERIRANQFGLGHFEFIDGTKLVVGPNSNIVIDEYVLGDRNRFKKLALTATRGAFRWISGKSPSSAYQISTPAGTLGVRGTAVDVSVNGDIAMAVLLQGRGQWCTSVNNRRQCVTMNRRCDFVVARRGAGVTAPQRVNRNALNEAGADGAFPFLTDKHRLLASYQLTRYNCGMGQLPAGRLKSDPFKSPRPARTPDRPEPQGSQK
jgi:hypothetical protein